MTVAAKNLLGFESFRDQWWRNEMPKPLADLYMATVTALPDRQLEALLHFGEVAVHFATTLALADAAASKTSPLQFKKWVKGFLPIQLGRSAHILKEAIAAPKSPFCPELRAWLDLPSTSSALQKLVKTRNENAHHGGPSGSLARRDRAQELARDLHPLLAGLEFLKEYGFGYLSSAQRARHGGWEGDWRGWRGEERSDVVGSLSGAADSVPRPKEVLLISPDGQSALSLSPLWAVVPNRNLDCLGMLVDVQGDGDSARLVYSEPRDMATKLERRLDEDPSAKIEDYYREPSRWHSVAQLALTEDAKASMRGPAGFAGDGGRLRLRYEIKTPFGPAWRAEDTNDHSEKLVIPVSSREEASVAGRKQLSDRLHRVVEPALPRFFGMERIGERLYLEFEDVEGQQSARQWLRDRSRLPPTEAATLTRGVLKALAEAHAAGLVHGNVDMARLRRAEDGRLRLTLPALPSDPEVNATTRHAVLLLDRHGVPTLPTPEQFDVAGAAHILAELSGAVFELGKRPPDLQFEVASILPPLAEWFDRASRRGDAAPFTNARDALLALEEAIHHSPGWTTAAQRIGAGFRPAAGSEASTVVATPVVVQPPPLSRRQTPVSHYRLTDALEAEAPTAATDRPLGTARSTGGKAVWGLAALLALSGLALGVWWWKASAQESARATPAARSPVALAAPPITEPPAPDVTPRAWDAIARLLPNGSAAEEWRHQRGAPGIRELFGAAERGDAKPSYQASDVRSGMQICIFSATLLRKTSSVSAEFSDGRLARLGNPNLPTAAGRDIQARLPAADISQTWALGCGGSVEWRQVDGAWLQLYCPPGDGDWEWWLYPDLPPTSGAERQILEAFSCNDAGVQAWVDGNPTEALRLLRKATTLTPNYGWAAARGSEVAAYLGEEAADLSAIAARSNFKGVQRCASELASPARPGSPLCRR